MDNLINYNGSILKSSEAALFADNRGFTYGDGFFESILVINGEIPLWYFHVERIRRSGEIMQLNTEHLLRDNFLEIQLFNVVPLNGIYRLKISIFRQSPGKYFPEKNDTQFLIQSLPADLPLQFKSDYFFSVGRSFQVQNADTGLWKQIKSLSALQYVIASIECKQSGFDDLLILTKSGTISESTNSNVFAIVNSVIYTSSLQSGCINGVFRDYLIKFMRQNGFKIIENELFWSEIENIEELFLTNAVQWIRPVTKVSQFVMRENKLTQKIIELVRMDLLKK